MIPIVSIVGESGSGKTELVLKLLAEIGKSGRTPGTIKHTVHDVAFDAEGKDTQRHADAGAGEVCIVSAKNMAFFAKPASEPSPEEIVAWHFSRADIILAEGFKTARLPKIVVLKKGVRKCDFPPEETLAVVARGKVDTAAPVFGPDDASALAELILKEFPLPELKNDVRLRVNGSTVPLKPFVKAFIGNTVKAMVVSLKGGKKPERVDLRIGAGF